MNQKQIAEMARQLDHSCMAAMELENRELKAKLAEILLVIRTWADCQVGTCDGSCEASSKLLDLAGRIKGKP